MTIAVKPTAAGTQVNRAAVAGGDFDPDAANNQATTMTTVARRL